LTAAEAGGGSGKLSVSTVAHYYGDTVFWVVLVITEIVMLVSVLGLAMLIGFHLVCVIARGSSTSEYMGLVFDEDMEDDDTDSEPEVEATGAVKEMNVTLAEMQRIELPENGVEPSGLVVKANKLESSGIHTQSCGVGLKSESVHLD